MGTSRIIAFVCFLSCLVVSAEENQKSASPSHGYREESTEAQIQRRDEQIFKQLKDLIKRIDAASRKGVTFPVKPIEVALRTEFMRRVEKSFEISWYPKESLDGIDKAMAQDNLSLFIDFGSQLLRIAELTHGYAKNSKSAAFGEEVKLLAAKAVIDTHNRRFNGAQSNADKNPTMLGNAGLAERERKNRLLASMVAGESYMAIVVRNIDEYGKKYKSLLSISVKEYEKLAREINQGVEMLEKKLRQSY